MSAAGRAKVAAAQKARWSKIHAEKAAKTAAKPVAANTPAAPKTVAKV
jgi:hypothetical protein